MIKTLVKEFKHNKGRYKVYKEEPSYTGETGVLGMVLDVHYCIETPPNGLGYEDFILFDHNDVPYSLHRWQSSALLDKCAGIVKQLKDTDEYEAYKQLKKQAKEQTGLPLANVLDHCVLYEQAFFAACWKLATYDGKGCYDEMESSDAWKEAILKEAEQKVEESNNAKQTKK